DDRWQSIDKSTRAQMGVKSQVDGEFWMTLEDWLREFEHVQICNLPPDSYDGETNTMLKRSPASWRSLMFDGVWSRGRTAGGCGQGSQVAKFWTNPQYLVEVKEQRGRNVDGSCMMIVACLQKFTRQKRMQNGGRPAEEYIQIRVYHVNDPSVLSVIQSNSRDLHLYPKHLIRLATSGPYINKREVTCRLSVQPGYYLIIPSTYEPNREGKFLIRLFAESELSGRSLVDVSVPTPQPVEMYRYLDGMGVDPKYEIKQWWDNLPPDQKQRVIRMAAPALGICCLLMFCNEFTRKIKGQSPDIKDFD
ncbi:hypothetical protein GJ496_001705, partial [Pomphorhynchus laevis]